MSLSMRQPTRFGKYLLLERIAVGGMAEVFVAKAFGPEGFERLLAIKKILPTMGEDAEFTAMFVDEARIAAQLAHRNIVQVLELGKHDESLYIAMEYISGRDLRQLTERFRKRGERFPVPQACRIVAEVCDALDYAHRKQDASGRPLGIVHRDVSPQNVLVGFEGEVKLIDFGIAKAESRLQRRTQAGTLKGKFSYMSPEQVKGLSIDGRSDVFAAGILLWELICGEKLFTGESDFAVLEKVRNGVVPAPRTLNPECPEALEKVILKGLATEPGDRYQTASELHDDLQPFTRAGDSPCGARQLAEWMQKELADEWEQERERLRAWTAAGNGRDASEEPTQQLRMPEDELPTQEMDAADLARAENRPDEAPAIPATPRSGRRWLLSAAILVALVALAHMWMTSRDSQPGKVVVTPSPDVPAELYIDGKRAGPLPPFVRTVAPGRHRFEVRAEGYRPFSTEITVLAGKPVEVEALLVTPALQLEGAVLDRR